MVAVAEGVRDAGGVCGGKGGAGGGGGGLEVRAGG